jgi:hypothetical protein
MTGVLVDKGGALPINVLPGLVRTIEFRRA